MNSVRELQNAVWRLGPCTASALARISTAAFFAADDLYSDGFAPQHELVLAVLREVGDEAASR